MAKFKTACPACNSAISVYSEWAGKQAVCPVCKSPITVPSTPSNTSTCPSCGKEQPIEKAGYSACRNCGNACLNTPPLSFKCAEKLPPSPDGIARIACPYCGRHYILSFKPLHNLIGCQDCMNIFACPAPAVPEEPQKEKVYSTMVLTPGRLPVQQPTPVTARTEVLPAEAAMKTMQLTPSQTPSIAAMKTMQLTPGQLPPQVSKTPQPQVSKTLQLTPSNLKKPPVTLRAVEMPGGPDQAVGTASEFGSFGECEKPIQ